MKNKILIILPISIILLLGVSSMLPTKKTKAPEPSNINQSIDIIHSNQWYSNIYKEFPTQPIYASPLAYKLSDTGIGISYPDVHKTPDTIYGSYDNDLTVGNTQKLNKPTIKQIGDWSIALSMSDKTGKTIDYSLVKGLPSITFHTQQDLVISFTQPYQLLKNEKNTLLITIKNHNYIISFDKNTPPILSPQTITLKNPTKVTVGILPTIEHYDLFRNAMHAEVTNTQATWNTDNNTLTTNYTFVTADAKPLVALFPHQYDTLKQKPTVLGTYNTLRGEMTLIQTNSFNTQTPLITPPATYTSLVKNHPDATLALKEDIAIYIHGPLPGSKDYFLGTWFGKGITLLQLADAEHLTQEKQELLEFLEPKLLTSLDGFSYNKSKNSVIAKTPEFGNENLNDHHFHYGYYIRAAAVLSMLDQPFTKKVKIKITPLIQDIANIDKSSPQFPFLRNYDIYESHSWADGYASFNDGNDQESSSEAIHTWYAIYLWSLTTKDQPLMNTALYLYNSEIQGTLYYWFGKNNMYNGEYKHAIGSIIWGGKVDFATWFSGETNMKYGIQILPITPGSIYLKNLGDFSMYQTDFHNSGGDLTKSWGDLFLILQSFYQPEKSLQQMSQATKNEDNTPHSLFLYMLYQNADH